MKLVPLFLFSFVSIATLPAALDLTPVEGVRVLNGIKFERLSFNDNGRAVTYERPRGWSYRVDGGRVILVPPNLIQAEAAIEQAQAEAGQIFNEETMKRLQEQAMQSVPGGSQKVELVSAEKNPLLINGHETFEVTVSYQVGGTPFRRSILFLNLPETQLRFRLSAREQDFEKIHRAFRGSIFSWQWQ